MIFVAPKNFKRGRLIANKYTIADLLIAICGIIVSLILEVIFLTSAMGMNPTVNFMIAMLLMIPGGTAVLFVVPNGVYHNIFTFGILLIKEMIRPKNYIWKGIETDVSEKQDEKTP